MNCTLAAINTLLTIEEKCNFVSENCTSDYINFYSLHYCVTKGSFILSSILMIFFLFILFFILSSTSDMFLSTAITKIVETFNINQNIAAVTLLAFGNGAPDVISSLVASAEVEGIAFSISSLIGGGMFVTSFVLGAVVFRGKDILVNSNMFNRDLLLYLISLSHIILIGIKKKISLFDSCGFIFIYILNILCAFYQGRKKKENGGESKENKLIMEEIMKEDNKINNANDLGNEKDINALIPDASTNYKQIELEQKTDSLNDYYKEYMSIPDESNVISEEIIGEIKEDIIKEQETYINNKKAYSEVINENMILARIYFKKKYSILKEAQWGEISPFWKIFYVIVDFPLTFVRELTIPISENKKWSKTKFCFLPLCDFVFISYVFKCKFYINI